MIGYVLVGSNDLEKSKAFYDSVLSELGAKRSFGSEKMQAYSAGNGPMLGVCKPYDEKPASVGNGTMVSLSAPSREVVDKVHAKALGEGARDEGAPGLRGDTFYGAYFRDPDGNKLCVFHMGG
jgi:predicted lactoylglutathione lyase